MEGSNESTAIYGLRFCMAFVLMKGLARLAIQGESDTAFVDPCIPCYKILKTKGKEKYYELYK